MLRRLLISTALLLMAGCVTLPAPTASTMVPSNLGSQISNQIHIRIDGVQLASAAKEGAAFEQFAAKHPLIQADGVANFERSIELTLVASGARVTKDAKAGDYVLSSTILGAAVIPYPEAYTILFAHYQLKEERGGSLVWSKNVYSQAKFDQARVTEVKDGQPDPAYSRAAAANLRQMVVSLSEWFSAHSPEGR